jgi:hypothetical protein
VSLELGATVRRHAKPEFQVLRVADGLEVRILAFEISSCVEWRRIEDEQRGVRLLSNSAMVLGATSGLVVLIWTSMMHTLEIQGTQSGRSESTQRRTSRD